MYHLTDKKGITLVELMITVAILGILVTIAIWNSRGMIDNYRLRGAARQVYGDMQMARLRAIKEGKAWAVQFAVAGNTYTVRNSGANNTWDDADDLIAKTTDLTRDYPRVNLINNLGGARVVFNPNGTSTNPANAINYAETVCNSTRGQQITVNNNTGNIRVISGAAC